MASDTQGAALKQLSQDIVELKETVSPTLVHFF